MSDELETQVFDVIKKKTRINAKDLCYELKRVTISEINKVLERLESENKIYCKKESIVIYGIDSWVKYYYVKGTD